MEYKKEQLKEIRKILENFKKEINNEKLLFDYEQMLKEIEKTMNKKAPYSIRRKK